MQSHSDIAGPATGVLRAAVVAVLVLTLAAVGLLVMAAVDQAGRPTLVGPVPPLFVPAVVTLLAGLGLAAVVEGVARVVGRPVAPPVPGVDAGLATAVTDLRVAIGALRPPPPPPELAEPLPEPAAAAEPAAATPDPYLVHFERMVYLLEEIKELTVLDEAGRQARGQQAKERRKHGRLEEADLLIHRQSWEQADALLTLLESLHPGDDDVLARRSELEDARLAHREAEWQQLVRQAEDWMALNRYDEAAAAVAAFREVFPAHTDAAGLAAMVAAERAAHIEAGVSALFAEIRTAVDGRQWRMALDGCQRFLAKYPGHAKAERIRPQVPAVQRNAEIEERHEQEERIKELAKVGQFADAAVLCEDLLARFPDAPQAASLARLLPRLRERSALADAAAE